jgi:hypothetical protein
MRTALLLLALATPLMAAEPVNLVPYGDLEYLVDGTVARPVWNRMGEPVACDQWRVSIDQPASGKVCLTTDSDQEFFLGAEGPWGKVVAVAKIRAAQPDTPVILRVSCYDRLTRKDQTQTFRVGTQWQEVRLEAKDVISGPCEIGIKAEKPGVAIFVDDLALLAENAPANPMAAEERIQPSALDLLKLQEYSGPGKSKSGRMPLTINVPEPMGVGPLSAGIPFPKGVLFSRDDVRVMGNGKPIDYQADVLARWHGDGSIMVILINLPGPFDGDPEPLVLEYGPGIGTRKQTSVLDIQKTADGYTVKASAIEGFRLSSAGAGPLDMRSGGIPHGNLAPIIVGLDGKPLRQIGPSTITLERSGPATSTFVIRSVFGNEKGEPQFASDLRMTAASRLGTAMYQQSLTNISREPWLVIRGAGVRLDQPIKGGSVNRVSWRRGGKLGASNYAAGTETVLEKPDEAGAVGEGPVAVTVRDFLENYPCGLQNGPEGLTVWTYSPLAPPVVWTQGMSKTIEFVLATGVDVPLGTFQTRRMPLLQAPAEWYCNSGVFSFLLPPDEKTFPIFEKRVGSLPTLGNFAWAQKDGRGLYGCFNYGDIPGDGGWANLETMGDHELLLHYLRTLSREHYDCARLAAEHYRDVDIHHGLGFCHTHCSNHTESAEGWSHAWVQGLADIYFLTGDGRCLDVLNEVGTRLLSKEYGFTTGRDWTRPIENLVDIYNATGDQRYLDCVMGHIKVLRERQEPDKSICGAEKGSWYEDRYTCGSAFTWYGTLAMARLHQNVGDDFLEETLLRELDLSLDVKVKGKRCLAYYPDEEISEMERAEEIGIFALGRGSVVFQPIGYAYRLTKDRKYLDIGMKVLAFCLMNQRGSSDASATSFMTPFLREVRDAGMGPREEAAAFAAARDFAWEQHPKTLVNGDLELGNFRNWDIKKVPGQMFFYDKLVNVGWYLDDQVKHDGKLSLRAHSDNFSRFMSASCKMALPARRRFRASIWVKPAAGMNPAASITTYEYDVDAKQGIVLSPTGKVENGWEERAAEFMTLTRAVAAIGVSQRNGTGDVWFDDASVQEMGPIYRLLTDNGLGRLQDARREALMMKAGGTYEGNPKIDGGDARDEGPIPFSRGSLTDGERGLKYQNVERATYSYWQQPAADLTISFPKPYRVRQVNLFVHMGESHATESVQLLDAKTQQVLGEIKPMNAAWYHFDNLDLTTDRLLLRFTRQPGGSYITVSEVEVWGD